MNEQHQAYSMTPAQQQAALQRGRIERSREIKRIFRQLFGWIGRGAGRKAGYDHHTAAACEA